MFRLDMRDRFFAKRVIRHWNSLPRAVVTAQSLLELKKHSDNGLRNMVWYLCGALWSQKLDSMLPVGPFQLKIFYHYVILWKNERISFGPKLNNSTLQARTTGIYLYVWPFLQKRKMYVCTSFIRIQRSE